MATLDRARSFAEVIGQNPYRYEQGGKFFNVDDEEVNEKGEVIAPAPAPGPSKKKEDK